MIAAVPHSEAVVTPTIVAYLSASLGEESDVVRRGNGAENDIDQRASELAVLFQGMQATLGDLQKRGDLRDESLSELRTEMHQIELRLSVRLENLSVRAGAWGAIGGAIVLAIPLGMALLLWALKGSG